LTLPIPRPVLDGPNSAAVVIAPEDNVSVTPRLSELAGLVSEPLPSTSTLPARLQSPLYYRVRLDADPKRFVADVRLRPRAVSVALRHSIRIEDTGLRVDHRLRYVVVNEPIARFQLALGGAEAAPAKIQFFLEDGSGPLIPLTAREADPGDEIAGTQWELELPEPRMGEFTIVARAFQPLDRDVAQSTQSWTSAVSLLFPVAANDTTITGNRLRLAAELPWRAEVLRHDWRILEATDEGIPGVEERYVGESWYDGPELAASVLIRWGRSTGGQSTSWVHNAWTQTWLGRNTRHDRSVWKITSHENQAVIQLPPGAVADEVLTAVDGEQVNADLDATGELRIPLTADGREHVIEVSCFLPRPLSTHGAMHMEFARLEGANSVPRFLWQLVTPRDEHLVAAPIALNPESQWGWRNGYWERQATWRQAELERWTGAAPQEDLPRETNQYLFSAVGTIDAIDVRLAPRSVLVFLVSAATLLVGLLFMYVRALRHPLMLSMVGLGLLAVAVTQPETAVVVAQAALLGWALTFLARMLHRTANKRSPPVISRASRSSVQRSVAEVTIEPNKDAPIIAPSTTATASPPFPSAAAPKA